MKKKVLHIRGSLKISGAANVAMNYLRFIDKKKFDVDFLVFDDYGEYEDEALKLGAEIIRLDSPNKNPINYCINLFKLLREKNYDIVHSHTYLNSGLNLMIAYFAGVSGRVSHSHTTQNKSSNHIWTKIYQRIMRVLIKIFSTEMIACTEAAGESLYGVRTFKRKGIVLINGIDINNFRNKAQERIELESANTKYKTIIGHIGRFSRVKNHEFVIEIFENYLVENPESLLLLVGSGELEEEIKFLTIQKGIDKNVIFTGNRQDVASLMKLMDLILLPSFYEGFPMVIVEAQVLGIKSLISSNITRKVDVTGLVKFMDLEEGAINWSIQINECLRNSDTRKEYHALIAEAGFDIVEIVEKLEKVYLEDLS